MYNTYLVGEPAFSTIWGVSTVELTFGLWKEIREGCRKQNQPFKSKTVHSKEDDIFQHSLMEDTDPSVIWLQVRSSILNMCWICFSPAKTNQEYNEKCIQRSLCHAILHSRKMSSSCYSAVLQKNTFHSVTWSTWHTKKKLTKCKSLKIKKKQNM